MPNAKRRRSSPPPRAPRRTTPPEPAEHPSLEALLENLGPAVATLIVAPQGLDVLAGEPVIFDPLERAQIEQRALVLAVGTEPGSSQGARLIRDAAAAGAAAVVFKAAGDTGPVASAAEAAGIAVLCVPQEMTWTQVNALLTSAVRFPARSGEGGMAGIPMGDLFALANAIAGIVGGATTIEDPHRRVLAYSTLEDQPIDQARRTSILGRQVPDFPGIRELYRRVWDAEDMLRANRRMLRSLLGPGAEFQDLQARTAVAVRAGNEIIGSIWVAHGSRALGADAEAALAEAARIAVPHLIQARASRDVERRMRAEMLRALLEGRASRETAAGRLGFSAAGSFVVLAFRVAAEDDRLEELQRERLVDLVGVYCEAFRRQAAAVAIGSIVYALVPVDAQINADRVRQLASDIAEHASSRLRVPLHAACGSVVDSARDLPRTRHEADRVLQVLAADPGRGSVARVEDVRTQVVLLELRDLGAEQEHLRKGRLEEIVAYDAEHGSGYTNTLRAYLDAFGDVPAAAAAISVHPNTFRYRLRRLTEIFALDLADPDERLVLSVQLRMLG